jgi:RNA polymerase primary sigma factor
VREFRLAAQETISLQTRIGDEEESDLGDLLADESAAEPADVAAQGLLGGQIETLLSSLNERERRVLELRFGLLDGEERTLDRVAAEFGVTRERVRQIETKAIRKLRQPSRNLALQAYLA